MIDRVDTNPSPHHHAEPDATLEGATTPEAAIFLPTQLLQPGELIILLIKPSAWFIVLECLRTLTVIAILAAGALWVVRQGWGWGWVEIAPRDIMLLAIGAAGVRLFWQFLEWLSRVYVLTDRRVIRVRGVIRVHVFEAALKQIQHTELNFSLRERMFALGSITFSTAGTGLPEASWQMVNTPLEVHQTILRTLHRYR